MDAIHRFLAYAVIGAIVGGAVWSAALARSGRTGGPRFEQYQAGVVSLVIVGAASGLLMLASGSRPADGLHLLYALIAIAVIPLARSFLGRTGGRRAGALLLAAFVALGAIGYRLFTTG